MRIASSSTTIEGTCHRELASLSGAKTSLLCSFSIKFCPQSADSQNSRMMPEHCFSLNRSLNSDSDVHPNPEQSIFLSHPRCHINHKSQILEMLGCAPIPLPSLHMHYYQAIHNCGGCSSYLHALKQSSHRSLDPGPFSSSSDHRVEESSSNGLNGCQNSPRSPPWIEHHVMHLTLTLVTPSQGVVCYQVMSIFVDVVALTDCGYPLL